MAEETEGLSGDEPLNQSPPPAEWEDISKQFSSLEDVLNAFFKEREEPIEGILVSLIAKQHVLLLGPPGTAKTMLTRTIASAFDLKHFWILLTRFSTPEDVFGGIDVKAFVEEHVVRRNTTGMFPEAETAHVDEIFKASPSILNTFLTAINERVFFNPYPQEIPLITLVGTSNEVPKEPELAALYDRFLLRFITPYINSHDLFVEMLKNNRIEVVPIGRDVLEEAWELVNYVRVPDEIYRSLATIRMELFTAGVMPSDRRFKQSLELLKARAVLRGRSEVTEDDLIILRNVLWTYPEERETVYPIILKVASPLVWQAKELIEGLESVAAEMFKIRDTSEQMAKAAEVMAKAKEVHKELLNYRKRLEEQGKETREIDNAIERAKAIRKKIITEVMKLDMEELE